MITIKTPNLDRLTNHKARMFERERERKSAQKPAPIQKDVEEDEDDEEKDPLPPPPIPAEPDDDPKELIEAVKQNGNLTLLPCDLSKLLGLSAAKDQTTLLSILEAKRHSLFIKGVRYFPHTGLKGHGQITFRMLELDG